MRLLVTGATGFIGSHLCERLLADGHEVWGASRLNKTKNLVNIQGHPNFHLVKLDLNAFEEVRSIFSKDTFDGIFHTAACIFVEPADNPFPYLETNVRGTLNILQAACLAGKNTRIIYSSSMNVYGPAKYLPVDEKHPTQPVNMYGLSKLMGEMLCQLYSQQYNFEIKVLRYSGVFGPRKEWGAIYSFADRALRNKAPIISSDGSDIWDALHVKDVCIANALALANSGKSKFCIFNIGSGKGINVTDVANKILRTVGSTAKPCFGNSPALAPFYYDISKARNVLRFVPTPFDESVREYIEWEKERRR